MYCLKCGREIEGQQVFCNDCLEIMDRYPVKSGTPIQLPKKNAIVAPKKQSRRNSLSPEDQIRRLRKTVRVLITLLLVVCLGASFFVYQFFQPDPVDEEPSPGQSWSVASDET